MPVGAGGGAAGARHRRRVWSGGLGPGRHPRVPGSHGGRHRPSGRGLPPPARRTSRARTIVGVGFDRDRLLEAGIERAGALAAVTNGDNSNIVVARVAREAFQVERVVARIYDQRRAAIYERLGIPTVATVQWTIERVLRRILPDTAGVEWIDPSRPGVPGRADRPRRLGRPSHRRASRSPGVVPRRRRCPAWARARSRRPALLAQEGDVVWVAVAGDAHRRVRQPPGRRPGQGRPLMRVVMVGGGNVGTYIATELHAGGHEVLIVEDRPQPGRPGRWPTASPRASAGCRPTPARSPSS